MNAVERNNMFILNLNRFFFFFFFFYFIGKIFIFFLFNITEIRSCNMRNLKDYDTGIGESTTTISPLGSPHPCRSSSASSSSSAASTSIPNIKPNGNYTSSYSQVK